MVATILDIFNTKRYVFFLYVKSLGNLITKETRDDVIVSAHIAWTVIPHLFPKVFLAPSH